MCIRDSITTPLILRLQPDTAFTQPVTITVQGVPIVSTDAPTLDSAVWLTHSVSFSQTTPLTITDVVTLPNEGSDMATYLYRLISQSGDWDGLPDGAYILHITTADDVPQITPLTLRLDRSLVVTATVSYNQQVLMREFPASSAQGDSIPTGTEVQIYGQVWYVEPDGKLADRNRENRPGDLWCYFRTAEGRWGWSWCVDFNFSELAEPQSMQLPMPIWDLKIDNYALTQQGQLKSVLNLRLPILAPPLPATLYAQGGQ